MPTAYRYYAVQCSVLNTTSFGYAPLEIVRLRELTEVAVAGLLAGAGLLARDGVFLVDAGLLPL